MEENIKTKCCDCGKELDKAFKSFDEDDFCKDCCMPCDCMKCNCEGACSNDCVCNCCMPFDDSEDSEE